MTFEKESGDPISEREHEQFTSIWASLAAGAAARTQILADWHQSWVDAYQQGVDGALEQNDVFEPHHKLSSRSRTQPSAATSSRTIRIGPTRSTCSSGDSSGWASKSAS